MTIKPTFLIPLAIVLLLLLGWGGGAGQLLDTGAILHFTTWRAAHPDATWGIVQFTHLGGAFFLLALTAAVAAWLFWRGERWRAGGLLLTVGAGRLGIELLKWVVNRPRPSFDAHPVAVFSQSFPSGHAGNTMVTFLALALFAVPERWRGRALAIAAAMSVAIGATRPVLGVHWPSDVLGGWIYGAAIVSLMWRWWEGRARSAA